MANDLNNEQEIGFPTNKEEQGTVFDRNNWTDSLKITVNVETALVVGTRGKVPSASVITLLYVRFLSALRCHNVLIASKIDLPTQI